LKHIKSSATQLDEVIQDLNQILSVRRQDQQDFYQLVDLEAETSALIESLEPELKDVNAQIILDFKQGHVFTIRAYVHSILYNLITNAIKYASQQHPLIIKVCSWQQAEFTYLSVQDNGRGFDSEKVLGEMFRLYKRFHPQIPGKGMGLYLVKTQAEALGGGVSVVSQENQGACFTIYVKSNPV
jgi:signal transduction histidine kinase